MILFNILLGITAFILLIYLIAENDNSKKQTLSITFIAVLVIVLIANRI